VRVRASEWEGRVGSGAGQALGAAHAHDEELVLEAEDALRPKHPAVFGSAVDVHGASPEPLDADLVGARVEPDLLARDARTDERARGLEAVRAMPAEDETREGVVGARRPTPEQTLTAGLGQESHLAEPGWLGRIPSDDQRQDVRLGGGRPPIREPSRARSGGLCVVTHVGIGSF